MTVCYQIALFYCASLQLALLDGFNLNISVKLLNRDVGTLANVPTRLFASLKERVGQERDRDATYRAVSSASSGRNV